MKFAFRWLKTLSVKTRIAFFSSILFMFMLMFFFWVTSNQLYDGTKKIIHKQQFSLVTYLAQEIDQHLGLGQSILLTISESLDEEMLKDNQILKAYLKQKDVFASLFNHDLLIIGKNGEVLADSQDRITSGLSLADRRYFMETIKTQKSVITEPISSRIDGTNIIGITVPIFSKDKKEVIGVLAGYFQLEYNRFFGDAEVRIGDTGYAAIVTTDNVTIFHPDKRRVLKLADSRKQNWALQYVLKTLKEGTYETVDVTTDLSEQTRALQSFKLIKKTNWIVMISFPLVEAFSPLAELKYKILLLGVIFILVLPLCIWFIMHKMLYPILALGNHMQQMQNQMNERFLPQFRIQLKIKDELFQLIQNFNELISELNQRTHALRLSERNFKDMADNVPGVVFQYQYGQKGFNYISPSIENIFEIDNQTIKHNYKVFYSAIHPADRARWRDSFKNTILTLAPWSFEGRIVTKHGQLRWISGSATAIRSQNEVILLNGVLFDITDSKYQNLLLKTQQEASPDGIVVTDLTGTIKTWNQRFCELWQIPESIIQVRDYALTLRYTLEQLEGPTQFVQDVEHILEHPHEASIIGTDKQIHLKNGMFLEWCARALMDDLNEAFGVVWYYRDVTERTIARVSLEESEQKYRMIFKAESDALFLIDLGTLKIIDVNDAATKIYGYQREEFFELSMREISADPLVAEGAICNNQPAHIPVRRHRRKDKSLFLVEINTASFIWKDSIILVAAIRDITERVRIEQELIQHRDHLEELIREQTVDLVHAKELAEAANLAKSEFLANMSHELRTPLHAIFGYAELIGDLFEDLTPDEIKNYLENIKSSGKRLLALLNDLLDLSKLEAGKMSYSIVENKLPVIVEQVMSELTPLYLAKSLKIIHHPIEKSSLYCDEQRISQVVRNLLSNAIKFTPEGQSIYIEYKQTTCMISGEEKPALSCFVIDEGVGIPPSELDAVFDKFIQSSKTKTGAGGTGLGLAICRQIIQDHQGIIFAENNENCGARFVFTLPIENNLHP